MHRLWFLVTENTSLFVWSAATAKSVSGPATVLVGQPIEKVDARWRPCFPNQLPGITSVGALERGKVAGACRVVAT
jgi:hypothetical protein